jgi:hypothetical protein
MKPSIQAFIDEYLIDHNGAEAARRAGYAASSAKQRAHILLKRPEVINAISERHYERRAREGLHRDEIICHLSDIARTAPSIAQRLRAYTLVMRYYGMLTGHRPPDGEAPNDFISDHIIRLQSNLIVAGKPFQDDVDEDEDLDLEDLEALIADDLAEIVDDPLSEAAPPPHRSQDATDQPDPTARGTTAPQPDPTEPAPPPEPQPAPRAPRNSAPHRAGPNHGGPAPGKPAPAKPAAKKPSSVAMPPASVSIPAKPLRSPPGQLPGVSSPHQPRIHVTTSPYPTDAS